MSVDPNQWITPLAKRASYRFLVAGHVYGSHVNREPGLFPAFKASWMAHPSRAGVAFGVLTGDIVFSATEENYAALRRDTDAMGLPLFVAPGNHDSGPHPDGGDLFEVSFGARRKAFLVGRDAYLIADSVMSGGVLGAKDLQALDALIAKAPRVLFLFVHHLIWIDQEIGNRDVLRRRMVNGIKAGYAEHSNWDELVLPKLIAAGIPVYVIAGDVGALARITESYERPHDNVHLLTSGMGDHPLLGTYLLVEVSSSGVSIETVPLSDRVHRIPVGQLPIGQ